MPDVAVKRLCVSHVVLRRRMVLIQHARDGCKPLPFRLQMGQRTSCWLRTTPCAYAFIFKLPTCQMRGIR